MDTAMNEKNPAEVFPPGDFLRDELEAHGWSQSEFAEIIGRPIKTVNEIIAGKRRITPTTAKELEAALDISARSWMNHETIYQLHNVQPAPDRIRKEAKIRSLYPAREMVGRGWLEPSGNPDVIETQILQFFEIDCLTESPKLTHAARRSESTIALSPHQLAWVFRVKQLATTLNVRDYSETKLVKALDQIKGLRTLPEYTSKIPNILADAGIRFVIIEPFAGSKIDGVCMWLNKTSPVIAMTLRYDRIDNFWFVLRHEIEHVLLRHGEYHPIIDSELEKNAEERMDNSKQLEEETLANSAAAEYCVSQSALDGFISEAALLPSRKKVIDFANQQGVHPGIVVGQLQRRFNRYDIFRNQLVKVREYVTSAVLTDGYGQTQPVLV
jgi:HTH-type transcriptional regulator/antitoxin HigA